MTLDWPCLQGRYVSMLVRLMLLVVLVLALELPFRYTHEHEHGHEHVEGSQILVHSVALVAKYSNTRQTHKSTRADAVRL